MGKVWHSLKVRAMTSDCTITQMYRKGERFPKASKHKKERQVMKANKVNTSGGQMHSSENGRYTFIQHLS